MKYLVKATATCDLDHTEATWTEFFIPNMPERVVVAICDDIDKVVWLEEMRSLCAVEKLQFHDAASLKEAKAQLKASVVTLTNLVASAAKQRGRFASFIWGT